MSVKTGSIVCDFGFFFDDLVSNCLPCQSVCGESGVDKLICQRKCSDYVQEKSSKETTVTDAVSPIADAVAEVTTVELWAILAAASIFLAVVSIILIVIFIWRRQKMTKALQATDAEESLVCPSHNFEEGNSQYNTERGQSARRHFHSSAAELSRHNVSYPGGIVSFNYDEDHPSIPKSATQVFDGRGEIDNSMSIILKSDLSLAGHVTKHGSFTCHNFSSSHLSSLYSSIYDMFQMFGWLNKTDWVIEYSENSSGLRIGVEGIGKAAAEEEIRQKGQRIPDFHFVVTTNPTRGRYVPCPNTRGQLPSADPFLWKGIALKPGSVLYSKAMEPDPETKKSLPGQAVYSGSLMSSCTAADIGITVGHLFEQENLELSIDGVTPIGRCACKYESVKHRTLNQVTADLALLQLCLPTENVID